MTLTEEATNPVGPSGKKQTELQRNAELVSNWYQSYYLWTSTAIMAGSVMNAPLTNHSARVLNMPLNNNSANTTSMNEGSMSRDNDINRRRLGRNNDNNNRDQPPRVLLPTEINYKVPSLSRRFAAECFDAVYIQCLKISLALFFINYTDIM